DRFKGHAHLTQSGVYFLFGTVESSGEDVGEEAAVYIGQAGTHKSGEGILYRLMEHRSNPEKDYWTEAVIFITSDNSFGPTEISWLENQFCNIAKKADRYVVKNDNDPSPGHVTEEKKCELEGFVDNAKIVMGTLGHKVLEPLRGSTSALSTADESVSEAGQIFSIKRSNADAKGMLTSEGFVVLAGSVIRKELVKSVPDSVKTSRKKNKKNIDESCTVVKDIFFSSPSGASSFVLGAPTNGNTEWKTAEGKSLKEVESGKS
ncbi:MAG: GIY-YIG nuclease family protein, partial [Synergistaceae bacterium]|nr:GIY-YIG nuclease family protein [Synergistaceae bacterium]